MPHFTKPDEGTWTEHFGLDTAPVSYADSTSPEHYAREQEAIFAKTWLNVGRVEQLAKNGSYFTKELDAADTSVVVTTIASRAAAMAFLKPPSMPAGASMSTKSKWSPSRA